MVSSEYRTVNERIVKPFLGGWRHKITGIEYFDAASQTGPPPKRVSWENTCSRTVQCVQIKDEATQSLRQRATQMWRYQIFNYICDI